MHVARSEDMNQKPDEGHEENVDAAQAVNRKPEVCAKASDVEPGPEMVCDGRNTRRCIRGERATLFECQIESDDGRNADRETPDPTDECLFTHTPTDEPVDGCPDQRRKDDVANHDCQLSVIRCQLFPFLRRPTANGQRTVFTVSKYWRRPHPTIRGCGRWL